MYEHIVNGDSAVTSAKCWRWRWDWVMLFQVIDEIFLAIVSTVDISKAIESR